MATPACAVDDALRMLDAHADGERFGFHRYAALVELGEGVACAVAQRHHHLGGGQGVHHARGQIHHGQPGHTALAVGIGRDVEIGDTLIESHFTAERNDLRAELLHHLHQFEGADVGVCGVENLVGRAGLHKLFHDLAAQKTRVLDLAVELAVRERARTAFAELHVRLGMQHALAPQVPGVLGALTHFAATLQHDRLEAHLREHQRRKNAARTKTNDHGAIAQIGGCLAHGNPAHVRCLANVRVLFVLSEQRGFLGGIDKRHVQDIDRDQFHLARIEAAFVDVQCGDGVGGKAQGQSGLREQRCFGMHVGIEFASGQGCQRQLDF